jgi:hypothetical protein
LPAAYACRYAELPHEGIGLIVANAFMAEYGEKLKWELEEPKPWEQVGGTRGGGLKVPPAPRAPPDRPPSRASLRAPKTRRSPPSTARYGCSSKLGAVLEKCCMLAQDALEAADKCQREYRSTEENKFRELSGRVQAAAATALDNLGNDIAYSIGCSVEGDRALNLCAARSGGRSRRQTSNDAPRTGAPYALAARRGGAARASRSRTFCSLRAPSWA